MFEKLKYLFTKRNQASPVCKEISNWKKLSDEERLDYMVAKSIELFRDNVEVGQMVAFKVPKTSYEAELTLAKRAHKGQDSWRLSVGVAQVGSDRQHSHYLYIAEGKEKIVAYLARPELKMEIINSVKTLSSHIERDTQ